VVFTAIKDAVEDLRRTNLDDQLNNSYVQKLMDWDNVNVSEDSVSLWRRFKKWLSHSIADMWRLFKARKQKSEDGKGVAERATDRPRMSIQTNRESYLSTRSARHEEGIPMTPVSSPQPTSPSRSNRASHPGINRNFSYEDGEHLDRHTDGDRIEDISPVNDNVINPIKEISGQARFKRDFWKNLSVGDFVRLYNDDEIPADIAVLSTSDPDGACYIETKNLDGETNLKVRQALRCGRELHHARDCERSEFIIDSEAAHANLYAYSGAIKWVQRDPRNPNAPGEERQEPIDINNLLLRGCNLRNTEWVVGVVIFTGQDTKIMLNSGISPTKRSRIARELNWNVIYNFCILFIMCFVSGVANGLTFSRHDQSWSFYEYGMIGNYPAVTGAVTFIAAVILYQNLVPISLYISLEIVRLAQAFFIYNDTYMYYEKLDYPCTPKTWNISDDLGQVEYIFSDKTGTLTQNVMEFKKCSVNGVAYGEAYTEALAGMQRRQGLDVEAEAEKANRQIALDRIKMIQVLRNTHDNEYLRDEDLTFVAPDFAEDLTGAAGEEQQTANYNFMLALALCHSVITERTPGDPPRLEFKAQSPDETALVGTARDCGFTVLGRQNDIMNLNIQGVEKDFTVLNTLEFNSTRKRMSAIIRMPDNKIMLFCKGADSVIFARLKKGEQGQLRRDTAEHLEMFAREGLRTLCVAQKELTEDEYQAWNKEHDIAAAAIANREEKLEAVSDSIERDLSLIGGTAIEDRLQDGVPDTISLLAKGGIKLWVLTGDKVETAINIGFACNLLSNEMELIVLRWDTTDLSVVEAELNKHLKTFNLEGTDEELAKAKKNHEAPAATHAIVIDGDALKLVLEDQVRKKFLLLCKQCKAVLCCRVSPSQKAAVVHLVKTSLDVMTLSIGDGANDVAMIQEADVGVGIAGEEGRQAVMSADYAIGQFRFLQRLVLVHGRWSYRRLGECIPNFFYKVSSLC
jgi:phospholipid-translocating ATPase